MRMRNSRITAVALGAAVLVGASSFGAVAAKLVTSEDIKNQTIRSVDIGAGEVGRSEIADNAVTGRQVENGSLYAKAFSDTALEALKGNTGPQGPKGDTGPQGPKGDTGTDGLLGAFYATAYYNAGDTNAGAIATVACDASSTAFTAIAGGVQVLGLDGTANSRNTPVSSSFPGRMDWSTNAPRPNRLDGWIVQFGGNAGATSDKSPEKVKLWALCVPNTAIPVKQTFSQVG